jgi:uncharacterized protein YeeX (DUF496 family)
MLTLDETMEMMEHRLEIEDILELLDIPISVFLDRFDDYIERNLETIQEYMNDE